MDAAVLKALDTDTVIDITTVGRRSGLARRLEIWFRRVDGRTYITGTPGPRDWYANLLATPAFTCHFKESVRADVWAVARPVLNAEERGRLFAAPEMAWYRDRAGSVAALVDASPLVEVTFIDWQPGMVRAGHTR